ncbi:farnesol dehydrogenase-like [Anopheles ziemanni]|uniref:farnesol dehydrogenase-like n=1 Tax=Anopheles coustani TaxID=139045 RepID=UPI00265AA57D|nr:farnesol dehydrogenase-like [Anopheles coustani]XP_058168123.1 farnesol dehydrogenase-like [Anopheles ziemanni]
MDRWVGKVAIVTGASSGIGAATVKALANAGMITIGLARRVERVDELKKELPAEAASRVHGFHCDVTKEEDILAAFAHVEKVFGGVDVLINNAGIAKGKIGVLQADNTATLRQVVDTNLMGLALCSREAFQSMKRRSVDGHIVHINSILGHNVPENNLNIYAATKYGVTALTETMRHELRLAGTKIKVTSISPGLVRTEIISDPSSVVGWPILEPEDISDAILYALGTPPRVQIHELTIKPVGERV